MALGVSPITAFLLDPGQTAAKPATQATKSSSTKTTTSAKATTTLPVLKGEVTLLDKAAKMLIVKNKAGENVTFSWDEKTTVKTNGNSSETVKVGDLVKILYTTSGDTKTAAKIFIGPPYTEDSGGGHPKGTCLCSDGSYLKKCCPGASGG
jgi:hypothetical protein